VNGTLDAAFRRRATIHHLIVNGNGATTRSALQSSDYNYTVELYGGDGNDSLSASTDNGATLHGDAGNDTITGESWSDYTWRARK